MFVFTLIMLHTSKKGKLGTNAMKREAAGAHLPTPWFFEPAKRPDDRADYCFGFSFLQCKATYTRWLCT